MKVFQEALLFCCVQRGWRNAGFAALPLVAVLAACGPLRPRADPYVVIVDVGPDVAALASDDLFESDPAADRLVALGASALPALDAALQREPAPVRAGVVGVLQQSPYPGAVVLLIRAARDPDPTVRREAILALGLRRDEEGRDVVEAALGDPDPGVRGAAATGCSKLCRSPAAIEALVKLALGTPGAAAPPEAVVAILTHQDARRAAAAREAIDRLAVPVLSQPDTSAEARLRAAVLVAFTGNAAAVPAIEHAARDEAGRRLAAPAILALGSVPDPSAVAALARIAAAGDPALTAAACQSLRVLAQRQVAGAAAALAACRGQGAMAN